MGLSHVMDLLATKAPARNPSTHKTDSHGLLCLFIIIEVRDIPRRSDTDSLRPDLIKDNKNINCVFGEQVVSIQRNEKNNGPMTIEFANGLPTAEYDLVVACDGATSRTQAIYLDCGVRDHIKTINCWVAYFSIE